MNEIIKLYKDSTVRIIEKDGDPWFVAKDVCDILGFGNPYSSLAKLDEDEKVTLHNMEGILNSRNQDVVIISEPGLYSLILRSRKPEAKMFKRWVTHDVLPSIRKTGAYLAPNIPLQKLQKLMESVGEQYKMLIENNCVLRQQLEYARQFVPKTPYGSMSPVNGQRRTTIRRGANVAGKGRLIERRDPEEVGYQMDLFGEYLPQIIFTNAVNIISQSNVKQLENTYA